MIEHKIEPHTERGYQHPRPTIGYNNTGHNYESPLMPAPMMSTFKVTPNTPKAMYNMWISRSGFNRGHYVKRKDGAHTLIHRVVNMQEVHMLLKYDDAGNALALQLVDRAGNRFYTFPGWWEVVQAPPHVDTFIIPDE